MYLRGDTSTTLIAALPQPYHQNPTLLALLLHPPNGASLQHSSHAISFPPPLLTHFSSPFHPTLLLSQIAHSTHPLQLLSYFSSTSSSSSSCFCCFCFYLLDPHSICISPMAISRATLLPWRLLRGRLRWYCEVGAVLCCAYY